MAAARKRLSGQELTLELAQLTLKVANESRTREAAAAVLGITTNGLAKRLQAMKRRFGLEPSYDDAKPVPKEKPVDFALPEFPDDDIPVDRIIELQTERFKKRQASFDAHTWFPIKLKTNKPVGVMWFGDPHLDDNGCDWVTLRRDIAICKETEGLYGANIGDSTNNWAGRLVRLYAEQDTSVSTARKLAEWFMLDSGVVWLVWILGNHDAFGDGSAILLEMAKRFGTHKLVLHDWEVRFSLEFPNGWSQRVYASHDFKGSSIYNPMHGPMREGLMGDDAHVYVCGHKHIAGKFSQENPARGHWQHFLRVRGYKYMDDFSRRHGFKEQRDGAAGVTVFDPETQAVSVFLNVEEGAAFLKMKRGEA